MPTPKGTPHQLHKEKYMDYELMWFKLKNKINKDYSISREKALGLMVDIEIEANDINK